MAKIPPSEYASVNTGEHGQGKVKTIVKGKLAAGGGKFGTGKKLKSMMVWKDTGAKGRY